ncbi:MAG TPA: ubiquinol-cytochrome c reductase iron-sulfur subunit, partial [Gemmatales bacterium]|nr:ubiquinol-cytochrome c reductase iron-sulfur subunit [Gemmatales bacterium]
MSETTPPAAPPPVEASPPAAAAPAKPAAPAAPAKPPAAKKGADRRFFLFTWFGLAWATFTASMAAMLLYTTRFFFPNVLAEPPSTFKAGTPQSFEPGKVVERYKADQGVWLVRDANNTIFALSTVCTHLGCTPNWLEAEQKFKCPCHGSGFKIDGVNFEGPAPRPLERYAIRRT